MILSMLENHLTQSSHNLLRNENAEKLLMYSEELLDTLRYLCDDIESLCREYHNPNNWAIDYMINVTPIQKFWNLNLLLDTSFYLRFHEIKYGNLDKFWAEYDKRFSN